jgi:hypothetical protein
MGVHAVSMFPDYFLRTCSSIDAQFTAGAFRVAMLRGLQRIHSRVEVLDNYRMHSPSHHPTARWVITVLVIHKFALGPLVVSSTP